MHLLIGNLLSQTEKEYYKSIKPGIGAAVAADAVRTLADFLQRYYDKKVIILLDEYDTPMQEAWLSDYWNEAVEFFRGFFNSTFKTNDSLERGLITGITRISKESVFSDLNNLVVITTTSKDYATAFGFTEEEVFQALENAGLGKEQQGVKAWYDGFSFGEHTDIYNPWSIASFIKNNGRYQAYWSNTSGNGLVNTLIQGGNHMVKSAMEDLLAGRSLVVPLDEQIIINQLDEDANAIWSLLLATGYLRVLKTEPNDRDLEITSGVYERYRLAITNLEVKRMFQQMIKNWFQGSVEPYYNEFINALLSDNVRKMNTFMNKVALNTFSTFDTGTKPSKQAEPERFYHGFVLGMVVNLSDIYKVRSNRESGFGRYDVMLEPYDKTKKAFIFEFKVLDPDEDEVTLEDTIASAHRQMNEKQYEAELITQGFNPQQIRKYGFAFQGKECLIG